MASVTPRNPATPTRTTPISLDDYLQLTALAFHWGDSYDTKVRDFPPKGAGDMLMSSDFHRTFQDWERLQSIIAPTLLIDYRDVMDERWHWEAMPAEAYIRMVSDGGFLGDPLVKTQYLLGATWWERVSDIEVIGHHQLRATYNRFTDLTFQRVDRRGHGHATDEHFYRKVNGLWKFAGLRPKVRWNDSDFERVFRGISFEDMAGVSGGEEAKVLQRGGRD